MGNVLKFNGDQEYTLGKNAASFWIAIDSIAFHIWKTPDKTGVMIDACPNGLEADCTLESLYTDFDKTPDQNRISPEKKSFPFSSGILEHIGETDYTLNDGEDACRINFESLNLHFQRKDEGVLIEVFPADAERMKNPISSCKVLFKDAENALEEFGDSLKSR